MSDVHSVGGYITAGSLFALGLSSWQVLVALLVGIVIVQFFCNLVAKPSQVTGTPYPVICRASFGVLGANIPAIIRGLIAVAWYGIQTYLASGAFLLLALHFFPNLAPYADVAQHGFAGLSSLGWLAFMVMWVLQALVFWHGMEAIRKFIDWAGPAVYVVMAVLWRLAGVEGGLEEHRPEPGGREVPGLGCAAGDALGDCAGGELFQRADAELWRLLALTGKSFDAVKKGNFWGLPVNFVFFSLLTVVTTAATLPVFGELITDPVHTVSKIDSTTAVVLGRADLHDRHGGHQHRGQLRVAGVRLFERGAAAHQLAHGAA